MVMHNKKYKLYLRDARQTAQQNETTGIVYRYTYPLNTLAANREYLQNATMKKVKVHIIFWVSYFLYAYSADKVLYPSTSFLAELVLLLTHNIFLFYASVYFLNQFSVKTLPRFLYSTFIFITMVAVFWGLRYINDNYLLPALSSSRGRSISAKEHLVNGIIWVGYMLFLAAAYFYYNASLNKERMLRLAQKENMAKDLENMKLRQDELEREKEKVKFEYAYLRAQINPHFLYNTLDFIYAKSLPCSKELSDGIMRLSEVLRYSVKAEDEEGLVLLADEIEHVKNVIEINRLRFNNIIYISFIVEGIIDGIRIIPLTLITLVENVLKHGEINNPANPAHISLEVDDQQNIHFICSNKKRTGPREMSTGIGLENTRRRLAHAYGRRYQLNTAEEKEYYKTELIIYKTDKT